MLQKAIDKCTIVAYNSNINTKKGDKKMKMNKSNFQGGVNMTRAEQNINECWDEENKEFDWDKYQHLCDCAEYWDCADY